MGNKERYYNHIVDNVVKNTIMIDDGMGEVTFPFYPNKLYTFDEAIIYLTKYTAIPAYHFNGDIKDKYGTIDQEGDILFKIYTRRMLTLLNNG